jgi:hypothetical protein
MKLGKRPLVIVLVIEQSSWHLLGEPSSKEYGGQYLNRYGNLYPGARGYLISIQNA